MFRWVGDPFPSFRLALLGRADERVSTADWRGRRVVVVVWTGHLSEVEQDDLCLVCRRRAALGPRGVDVVGLAGADPWGDHLPSRCTPFPIALDPAGRVAKALGLPGRRRVRAAYLVGPDGRIESAAIADRVGPRLLDLETIC